MANKNTICLWYDGNAMDAARFYAETFPDSAVGTVMRAPGDYPDGKQGDVLTVEFTVAGIPCVGLNGGPAFKHNEAFSFQISTEDQAETELEPRQLKPCVVAHLAEIGNGNCHREQERHRQLHREPRCRRFLTS